MTEPVAEQILESVRERVALAFEDTHRSTRIANWQLKDWSAVVYQLGLTPAQEFSCPGNPPAQGWTLEAAVAGIVKPSDRDETPVDTYKMRMQAEVITAITDATDWHNWGGLAITTEFGPVEDFVGAEGHQGVAVRLLIHFRTNENDPYTARA